MKYGGLIDNSKMNAACFTIKTVTSLLSREVLRILYFFLRAFHYDLWCNTLCTDKETGNLMLFLLLVFCRIRYKMYI